MFTSGPERRKDDSSDDEEEETHVRMQEDGNLNSVRRGTEIRLKGLEMKENVASLQYGQIKIIVQCGRCKTNTDLETPAGRVNMIQCGKCHNTQLLTFRPSLIHQFSSVLGYLDLDACVPFDMILQDSAFKITCLSCNKDTKVDVRFASICQRKLMILNQWALKFY